MNKKKSIEQKIHDAIRMLQWLIPALLTFFSVLDEVFMWDVFGPVNKIAMALVTLLGVIAQRSSKSYFENDVIVKPKDFTAEEIEEIMNDE